ncbi:aquaporin [Candidatus Saccharibacteria bacterium]|nr:aquaporin [Candidatus Saccharibacteria bacterium]
MKVKNINVEPTTLLAEVLGTFILATVALTIGQPLLVGLTLVVLIFALGAISGAHLNPVVTFGLWSVKKLDGVKVPFYWAAQFSGALFALVATQLFKGDKLALSFASFGSFDTKIVVAELIGATIFTFTIASMVHRNQVESAKAAAIGLALMVGLYVGGGLLNQAAQNIDPTTKETPRVALVEGVLLNPAIALAATEKVDTAGAQSLLGAKVEAEVKTPASRFTLETIVGGLVGGALGANLYMVLAGASPFEKKKTITAKVTTAVKKSTKKKK